MSAVDRYQQSNTAGASPLNQQEEDELRRRVIATQAENEKYLRNHPEIRVVLSEVTRQAILRRPASPVAFVEHFLATEDLAQLVATANTQQM